MSWSSRARTRTTPAWLAILLGAVLASVPALAAALPVSAGVEFRQETQEEGADEEQAPLRADNPMVSTALTDEEEAALRLVEEILAEQEVILAGQNFVYRAEERRDPFRNLLRLRRRELTAPTERPPGLPGFLISEVQLKGTALFQGQWHAMLVGLDDRTYFAEVGSELFDGRIVAIDDNEVVFEQEVENMLGARSTRQVVKKLTEGGEGP